jgi:hypothetical protein
MFHMTHDFEKRAWHSALIAMLLVLASGCGSEISIATVEGRVTKDGQPQANHWVRFTPVGGGRAGNGRTDGEGRYELAYTYKEQGARVGPNRVEVGTGGEIDSRGSEISAPVQVYSTEKVVEDGDNVIDLEISGP